MTSVQEAFSGLAAQLRSFGEANSQEARSCAVGEELRRAACQGSAQAYYASADLIEQTLKQSHWQACLPQRDGATRSA